MITHHSSEISLEKRGESDRVTNVLVVDDDRELCTLLLSILTEYGLDAASVMSGAAALEFARSKTVKVMLLDLMMPDMTGFEVLRAVRAGKETSKLPVVIYSAKADSVTREQARLLGAQGFVVKSVDSFNYLHSVLSDAIANSSI